MLISQAHYARLKGVRPATIAGYIKRGRITLVDGKIDPQLADRQLAASDNSHRRKLKSNISHLNSARGKKPLTFTEASTMREAYRAQLAKLDYEVRIGRLLPIDQVKQTAFEAGRQVREAFMVLPERISAILVGQDAGFIRARLEEEVQLILRNVLPP